MVTENRLYSGPNESYQKPRIKRFLIEIQDGIVPSTWWTFDDVVLDFFSGSAATSHAVMSLNAEAGGNRRYIMVQLPRTL